MSLEDTEADIRKGQKLNSNAFIQSLIFMPHTSKCQLLIPLCRMVALPLVRPILQSDICRLEQDFWAGYRGGDRCFYVSTTNDHGESRDVRDDIRASWNDHWVQGDQEFEETLKQDPDLLYLSSKLFFVWDGNHRLMAWYPYIASKHSTELSWHYAVEARLLVTLGHTGLLINAINDINRY